MQRVITRMHVRYLVEDLVRHRVDGRNIFVNVDGGTGTTLGLAWGGGNIVGVGRSGGEGLDQGR